jgi:putative spermidine/putrescine transport system substrate-binding protein
MAHGRAQRTASTGGAPRHTRRQFLRRTGHAAAAAAFGGYLAAGPATIARGQARKQIVVSTWGGVTEDGLRKIVSPVFESKYNATVAYDIGGAAARYNKLLAEGANPQINIMFNVEDILVDAAGRGLLAKFNPANVPNAAHLYTWATPKSLEGYGAAYSVLAYGLLVGHKIDKPVTSWRDLWRPEFRGKLAIAAPSHSMMPQLLIVASELHGGGQNNIEPGLKALAELRPVKQSFFWTDYAALVKTGDVILATEFDYYALFMQQEGYGVSWVMPVEKGLGSLEYAALVKGAPNRDLAEAYLNLLLDPDVQLKMAQQTFNPPTNKMVKLPLPLADQVLYGSRLRHVRWFDAKFINDHRAQWLERINTDVVPKWRI